MSQISISLLKDENEISYYKFILQNCISSPKVRKFNSDILTPTFESYCLITRTRNLIRIERAIFQKLFVVLTVKIGKPEWTRN